MKKKKTANNCYEEVEEQKCAKPTATWLLASSQTHMGRIHPGLRILFGLVLCTSAVLSSHSNSGAKMIACPTGAKTGNVTTSILFNLLVRAIISLLIAMSFRYRLRSHSC